MADVSTPSSTYNSMIDKWEMIHDLLGGTFAMREARDRWLPKESKEVIEETFGDLLKDIYLK